MTDWLTQQIHGDQRCGYCETSLLAGYEWCGEGCRDAAYFCREMSYLFDAVTAGQISKPFTDRKHVEQAVEERVMQAYRDGCEDAAKDRNYAR